MGLNVSGQIRAAFDEHRKKIEKAEIIALNRAGKSALAQTVMFIRKTYNIKSSDLKDEIKIKRASRSSKTFRLEVSHKGIQLIKYGAARQTKSGINVTIQKGKRQSIKSAFITTVGKGKHTGVFKRLGKDRLPIKQLYGASAMQLMSSKQAQDYIEKIFQERFEKELIGALEYGR